MKIYQSCSMAEKIRMIEQCETEMQQRQQQQMQQEQQLKQQEFQLLQQQEQMRMEHEDMLNTRDNETKILIAELNAQMSESDGIRNIENSLDKEKLLLQMKQLDQKMELERNKFQHQQQMDKARLTFDKDKAKKDQELKAQQIQKTKKQTN